MTSSRAGVLVLVFTLWCPVSSSPFGVASDQLSDLTQLLQVSATVPGEEAQKDDCHDVQEGDQEHSRCWKAMKWAKTVQFKAHPDYYRGLSENSPVASFQSYISFCPAPCRVVVRVRSPEGELISPVKRTGASSSKGELISPVKRTGASSSGSSPDPSGNDSSPSPHLLSLFPEFPKMAGCYAWTNSGCPAKSSLFGKDAYSATWRGDPRGGKSPAECSARAASLNAYCGSSGMQMLFVPQNPTAPGCYAYRPFGCLRHQDGFFSSWRQESMASAEMCDQFAGSLDSWCGSRGTIMFFLPAEQVETMTEGSAPEAPPDDADSVEMQDDASKAPIKSDMKDDVPKAGESSILELAPGCYARNPRGCPSQAARPGENAFSKWRRDATGGKSASECKARAAALDSWCGSSGMQTIFRAANPSKPGCYAWRPFGCPRQQIDRYDEWHAERQGKESFAACKARAAPLDHWCGSPGTQTFFVPTE